MKIVHYFNLELAAISTKPHQAPLAAYVCSKLCNIDKKYGERKNVVRKASKDQITLGSLRRGNKQAITNLALRSHSPKEQGEKQTKSLFI